MNDKSMGHGIDVRTQNVAIHIVYKVTCNRFINECEFRLVNNLWSSDN